MSNEIQATFLDVVRQLGMSARLSQALSEVSRAVAQYQREGALTITFKVRPAGDGRATLHPDIKTKAPRMAEGVVTVWPLEHGHGVALSDPNQLDMLRPVSTPMRAVADPPDPRELTPEADYREVK